MAIECSEHVSRAPLQPPLDPGIARADRADHAHLRVVSTETAAIGNGGLSGADDEARMPESVEAGGSLLERVRGRVVTVSAELGVKLLEPIERWIGRRSPVGDTAFYEVDRFPWIAQLEAHLPELRAELDAVLTDSEAIPAFQDISVDQVDLSDDDRWKTYFLFGYGFEVSEHTAACPRTTELVRAVPGMKTAMFSILAPGKHIPNHRGPYKGVLRYQLGMIVPEPAEQCRIRVGDEIRYWRVGESMVFDDTYDHEVWNDTDGQRVVLFLDVVRPLTGPARRINAALLWLIAHSPLVRDARRRQERWTAAIAQRRADQAVPPPRA